MNFIEAVQSSFRRYGSATGRSSRSEYWYWTLFTVLVGVVTFAADYVLFPASSWGPIETLSSLALLREQTCSPHGAQRNPGFTCGDAAPGYASPPGLRVLREQTCSPDGAQRNPG